MENGARAWSDEEKENISRRVMEALEQVIDPELGIDIVNLGLVYKIDLYDGGKCVINMTLTTMGCPLADVLTDSVMEVMKYVPEVKQTEVQLVWSPAWDTSKMSRYARIALGIR